MNLKEEKIFANGTEVLIFKYMEGWKEQDTKHFIKGKIISSELSDDISYHGSPWCVINYNVLGEDGNEYFGNMGHHYLGGSFFMTREMYINHLNNKIANNKNKIKEINNENKQIITLIKSMQKIENITTLENKEHKVLKRKK